MGRVPLKLAALAFIVAAVAWPLAFAAPTLTTIGTGRTIYFDDWVNIPVNNGKTECSAALKAAFETAGARGAVILGPGSYLIDPTQQVTLGTGQSLVGQGLGATTIQLQSGKTGIGIRLGSQTTLGDLTIAGNDEASTTGATCVSGGATAGIVCRRVRFKDLNLGAADNGIFTSWLLLACEWESNLTADLNITTASKNLGVFGGRMSSASTYGINLTGNPVGVGIYGVDFEGQGTGVFMSSPTGCVVDGCRFNSTVSIAVGSSVVRCAIGENTYGTDEIVPGDVVDKQCTLRGKYYGSTEPAAGVWQQGDVIENRSAGSSGATAVRWFCSTAGTAGSGAVFQPFYRGLASVVGTATWDPGSLATGASEGKDVTVAGATVGATAVAGHTAIVSGMTLNAVVTSSTNVRVTLTNVNAANPTDVSSGTVTVRVLQ